jgi:hypothetical protein
MLKKLSLAALVAMGGMSVATATPLTDAIKNVDLSGFLRVRFYNENPKNGNQYDRWRTNAVLIFKVPVDEKIKFVMRNSVESNVYTDEDSITNDGTTSVDSNIVNNLLFMQYSNGPVNAIVGKIPVATSITSADPAKPGHGAGVIATYKANDNVTLGAAFIDAMVNPQNNTGSAAFSTIGQDTYAGVILFNTNMVKGNLWAYKVTNAISSLYTLSVDFTPIKNVAVHADYAAGKYDDKIVKNADTHTYFNVSAKTVYEGVNAQIGYAKTNKKQGIVELSDDAPIGDVLPVEKVDNIANMIDTSAIYAKLGYNIDSKTNVYAGYAKINRGKDAGDNDSNEYKVGVKYKVNKKLSFDTYYDIYHDNAKDNNKEFRFEAKYSF